MADGLQGAHLLITAPPRNLHVKNVQIQLLPTNHRNPWDEDVAKKDLVHITINRTQMYVESIRRFSISVQIKPRD